MEKFYRIIEIIGATFALLFSSVMLFMQLFSQVLGQEPDIFLLIIFGVCAIMSILWLLYTLTTR